MDTHKNTKTNYDFLNLFRGLAVLIVIFSHIATWYAIHNHEWLPLKFIAEGLMRDAGIFQNGGPLGVCLFFLISGFLITYVSTKENHTTFAIKRIFRIFPPFIFCSIILYLLILFSGTNLLLAIGFRPVDSSMLKDFIFNLNLWDPIRSHHSINPVVWTLVIEVMFYTLTFILLKPLKKYSSFVVASELIVCLFFILLGRSGHPLLFKEYGFVFTFLIVVLLGQITYLLINKNIEIKSYFLLILLSFGIFLIGDHYYNNTPLYGISENFTSVIWAFLIFNIGYLTNKYIKVPNIINYFSKISYSLYLFHLPLLTILLPLFIERLNFGYLVALILSLAIIILISNLSYIFIEKTSQDMARKLILLIDNLKNKQKLKF